MKKVPESIRKELAALSARPDRDVDFSDLPPTSRKDWAGAQCGAHFTALSSTN
jgi:hypothetical protein